MRSKIFGLCFRDDNAPHGLLDFFTGGRSS
jgi:hypothetical protein